MSNLVVGNLTIGVSYSGCSTTKTGGVAKDGGGAFWVVNLLETRISNHISVFLKGSSYKSRSFACNMKHIDIQRSG